MASETKQNNPRSEAFRSDKGRTAGSSSAALTLFVKCGVETWMLRNSWAQLEDFWRVPAVTEPDSAQGQVTYEALCKGPSGTLGDFPHLKQQVLVTTFSFFFFFSREEGFSFLVSIIVISSTDYLYIILVSFLSGLTVVKGLCCHNSAFFCNTDGVDPVQTLPQVIFTCSNTPRTYLSFTESKMAQNVMPRRPIAHYSILLITK